MGNSLQEQLLKAGLVTEEDVARALKPPAGRGRSSRSQPTVDNGRKAGGSRARKGKSKSSKARNRSPSDSARPPRDRHSGQSSASPAPSHRQSGRIEPDLAAMSVGLRDAKRRSEDLLKDGKLRSHSPEKREREMKRRSVLRIIERSRQDRAEANVAHNFVRGTRIKTVYFTSEQHQLFKNGDLVVVGFEGRHSVISGDAADELQAIDPEVFVHRFLDQPSGESSEDDGYPPVPDDLMW